MCSSCTESTSDTDDTRYLLQPICHDEPQNIWQNPTDERHTILEALAQKYLSIPATSASVEKLFNVTGAIIRALRSHLAPETVESLILRMEMLKNN